MLDDPRTDPSPVRASLEPLDDYVVIQPSDESVSPSGRPDEAAMRRAWERMIAVAPPVKDHR